MARGAHGGLPREELFGLADLTSEFLRSTEQRMYLRELLADRRDRYGRSTVPKKDLR